MVQYLVTKQGIPVLVSSRSDPAALCPCTLFVNYSKVHLQASLYLRFSLPVYSYSEDQTFTLIYHAHNLVPGVNSLKPSTTTIPQDRLVALARSGSPELRVLALAIKQSCPIRCPPSTGIFRPKDGFDVPFHQLQKIAQATEIDVLFDYNWVHADKRPLLDGLIKHPEGLAGLAKDGKYTKQQCADWTVLGPINQELPPSYASDSHKRSRQITTGSPPRYPSPKRILLDAAHFPGSPTEKATTTTQSPSPRPSFSDFPDASLEQIASLRALLSERLDAVAESYLRKLHSDAIAHSQRLHDEAISHSQKLHDDAILQIQKLCNDAMAQLRRLHDDDIEYAHDLRKQADCDFEDVLEEYKLEMIVTKDEGIDEMNRVMNDRLEELREQAQDIVDGAEETLQEEASGACDGIYDKLIAMLDKDDTRLRRQREWSGDDEGNLLNDKMRSQRRGGRNMLDVRSRRAASAPL
ncbi:hypothetical protein GMOD_00009918 [Pyrenophora seminiperda CCB06]|uniref:Uncharacterized protein n=1 Tax=Pyrenophora seminiperda CCB06 TaxID=1302712 RepID=A0A3M7M1F0_9PLEO|nr:hypothetical protein GMOD_00009918 [Pyrenophora seminiperda CCB06]